MAANVITFASTKGGCGKSVLSDATANFLVRKNQKVLLIDLNSQMDLTLEFKLNRNQREQSNIYRAFVHDAKDPQAKFSKDFKPVRIRKNLDILTASKNLRNVDKLMRSNATVAPYVLSHLFSKQSGLDLSNKYDYVIIDTHNDTDVPVKNAFVMSDYVLAPVIPSLFGINSVQDTINVFNYLKNHLINPINRKSFIHAKLRFVGNLIRFNTRSSNLFMKATQNNPQFIAFIHELELFNKAQTLKLSIFNCAEREAQKNNRNDLRILQKRIIPQLNKIIKVISK